MALVDDFTDLYDRHVYHGGRTRADALTARPQDNPRALARAVDYSGDPLYPKISGITTGIIHYHYPTGSSLSALDARAPTAFPADVIKRLPEGQRDSFIAESWIAKRASVNSLHWPLGADGLSVLLAEGIIFG